MYRRLLLFVAFIIYTFLSFAQCPLQRLPENGANGYNGSTPRSFIIQWDSLEGAVKYEYVVTDNNLCFRGCLGDTRTALTPDLFSKQINLALDKWYYWVVRAIMKNGDTTYYSPIHSFYTAPRPEDKQSYFSLGPIPAKDFMDVTITWPIDPDITLFNYILFNFHGETIKKSGDIYLTKSETEQTEVHRVDFNGFALGLYFIEIKTNKTNVPQRIKFLIH